jgi:hypothetical protein
MNFVFIVTISPNILHLRACNRGIIVNNYLNNEKIILVKK